jgi:hypothetical protein
MGPVPREFDVRRRVVAGVDKRGRPVKAFERAPDAKKRVAQRVAALRDGGIRADLAVAEVLEACRLSDPCGSLACSRCARVRRIKYPASVLEFLDGYALEDLRFLTLINPAEAVAVEALHTFDPQAFVHRTRRQLERAGIDKRESFLIGGVDGEWDEGWELYQPHLHAVTCGITKDDLKRLIASWKPDPGRVRARKRLEPIDDLPRIATYLEKSWWPAVARKNNRLGIHPHDKRRLPPHIEREVLHWLHQREPSDLRLLYGVNRIVARWSERDVHTKTRGSNYYGKSSESE